MRQLVSKITLGTTMLFAVSSIALHPVSAAEPGSDSTKVCHSQPQSWSGYVGLAAGESFATGVNVDQQIGEQGSVSSVAVSTGEGQPTAIVVRVGDAVASTGATIGAGAITVSNNGANTVHLTSVDLVVTQCQQVAISDAPSLLSSGVESSAMQGSARVASEAPLLPETGAASRGLAVGGLLLIGAGVGLVAVARRRRLA